MNFPKNVIEIHLNTDSYKPAIEQFKEILLFSTPYNFKSAELYYDSTGYSNIPFSLKLNTTNDTVIKVSGLYEDNDSYDGRTVVQILRYCGFKIDDELALAIINSNILKLEFWNEKYL